MSFGKVAERLDEFFTEIVPLSPGESLLVAFSGGPDSTALLWGLSRFRRERQLDLVAAHLDHGLDSESGRRAQRAAGLAAQLGVPFVSERATSDDDVSAARRGSEDWARRMRYAFLDRQRRAAGARWVAIGHHRDDQVETILLRLLLGSGLEGLGGMPAIRDPLVRPLLPLTREELSCALVGSGLEPAYDISNTQIDRPRNLLRHRLVPHLSVDDPSFVDRVCRLGAAGRAASQSIAHRLAERLTPRTTAAGASIDLDSLRSLPLPLWAFALALLHRTAGLPYPPPMSAQRELTRQLERSGSVGCDCGSLWAWSAHQGRLVLRQRTAPIGRFTYTLEVPGRLDIPELGVRLSVRREKMASWMLEGRPTMAALDLPLVSGDHVVVRNRQPGDRIQPFGCHYSRRLKEILIDRQIPRSERDRLPLLCVGSRIAWVPGVTVHDAYRLKDGSRPWVASIEPT